MMERKLADSLQEIMPGLGFGKCIVKADVKNSQEEREAFEEKKKEEDHSKVVEAMMERKKQEDRSKKAGDSGSLRIGYPIKEEPVPIETIQDERRIAIQGYF